MQYWIPDGESAGGKTGDTFLQRCRDAQVIALVLVGWVYEYQASPWRWRQHGLAVNEAIGLVRGNTCGFAGHGLFEQAEVATVQFEKMQPILATQSVQRQPWRARVVTQPAIRIEQSDGGDVGGERRRQIVPVPQAADAGGELGVLPCLLGIEQVAAGTGVAIDDPVRLFLLVQVIQQLQQDAVFENIGVVAGVKGVAVAQHVQVGQMQR